MHQKAKCLESNVFTWEWSRLLVLLEEEANKGLRGREHCTQMLSDADMGHV